MNISAYLTKMQTVVDQLLERQLPDKKTRPKILHEAMHYCVFNGGKRIRPILCIATAELFQIPLDEIAKPATALELFHCSTLIHDDLPCMDDDDLRRGKPTCHIKFGEANAVLTGDALMIQAFQVLAETNHPQLSLELAKAAGSKGVIAGQVEDLAAENTKPSADLIEFIHLNKTAILIQAAIRMGAILGNATPPELNCLSQFGEKIGLAFQIEDDILDETSSDEILGKPVGSDLQQNKLTYPAVHGMQFAQNKVHELTTAAIQDLQSINRDTSTLSALAKHLMQRKK